MTKSTNWPYIINMGNSIIGVTVLAMPFCFRTCGVILGILLLSISSVLTYMSCSLLVKAASHSRKHTYEYLAFHTFGSSGKFAVEVSIIGLLLGTCIAFYVIIGDLGPSIVSRAFSIENTPFLRTILMVILGLVIALPLGLLRDLESLSSISAVSLTFYCIFVVEVIMAAIPNLISGVWFTKVVFWNPDGIFKCLPIFSLAFSCQTQLFMMYQNLPDPTLKRMSSITKSAIILCCSIYLSVGYFGYVAFCDEEISGDVLMNFRPTFFSELIKFGFVISVATSFPLVIFPCRSAIYTLLYPQDHDHSRAGPVMIPEKRFKIITICIVIVEFVLALTGATMGSVISFIFPAVMFISIMNMTQSKTSAQFVLFLGISILIASTYVTLVPDTTETRRIDSFRDSNLMKLGIEPERDKKESDIRVAPKDLPIPDKPKIELNADNRQMIDNIMKSTTTEVKKVHIDREDKERQEPANPIAPDSNDPNNVKIKDSLKEKQSKVKVTKTSNGDVLVKEEAKLLLKEIKENHQQQKKMIEQQKEILDQMKLHQLELHKDVEKDDKTGNEIKTKDDKTGKEIEIKNDKVGKEIEIKDDKVGKEIEIKDDKVGKDIEIKDDKVGKEIKTKDDKVGKEIKTKDDKVRKEIKTKNDNVIQLDEDKLKNKVQSEAQDVHKRSLDVNNSNEEKQIHIIKDRIIREDTKLKTEIKQNNIDDNNVVEHDILNNKITMENNAVNNAVNNVVQDNTDNKIIINSLDHESKVKREISSKEISNKADVKMKTPVKGAKVVKILNENVEKKDILTNNKFIAYDEEHKNDEI